MKYKINSLLPKVTNIINSTTLILYNKCKKQQRSVSKAFIFFFDGFLFLVFILCYGGKEQLIFLISPMNPFIQNKKRNLTIST